ncbi:membrane protein [Virgisporangium aliadipatigenens]|uniref:Membrane protein n=1 Tax=Virgisporangium aliadipatigenens TaxID=741659 RepID=A0A8J3YVR0_9ACTN|nr:hypothetical protein [Virgisporangium aliadipatigenens]GIJ52471.1 membrane protein [Virgisporangium aliadipatigenens]
MGRIGNHVRGTRFPRRLVQLQLGLALYGLSLAVFVRADLGLDPWDVFHQGVAEHTGLGLGWIVNITGAVVLLLWIPLRQRPGIGTVSNVLVVGTVAEVGLALIPTPSALWIRALMLATAIVLNGVATGAYIGARLGPGPRDGLMTGLKERYPRLSIRLVRTAIEVTVLAIGFLLGGSVGVGTIAYALAIGPLSQIFLPMLTVPTSAEEVAATA